MTKLFTGAVVLLLSMTPVSGNGSESRVDAGRREMAEKNDSSARDERMSWWREARFGMFIHWGIYSVHAGVHDGKRDEWSGEWLMERLKIPVAEYAKYAEQFNPVKFNADEWVRLAKDAGMKYIIITAKHHDGFAMYPSKVTDFDIGDATPFKRDPLAELAEACTKHGVRLGFYYSHAQDWHHKGAAAMNGHWDKAQDGDLNEYIKKIAIPQLKEILTGYGPDIPAVLWWDTPCDITTPERADKFLPLLKLKPGIITNDRLAWQLPDDKYLGDLGTAEQEIPETGFPGRDWESCMTINESWGYRSYDDKWKSGPTLISNLVDIVSKGGNLLLNVGPTSEGLIPGPSVERLKEIGRWMKVNGESIYGTTASPFEKLTWGRCSRKGGTLYFHVFNWPKDGKLVVPGLKNKVKKAYLLSDPGRARLRVTDIVNYERTIEVGVNAPDPVASVVAVEIEGEPVIEVCPVEKKKQHEAKMSWWREARFGMFIHWGIYSVPGGIHNGEKDDVVGEWIMRTRKIPVDEYAKYAEQFNPVKFNADEWVSIAKNAGMKYMVITAKHHDGFAMYPSKVSSYNIYDATPFKRDPLKELAEACREQGIRLGFYYSQALDWHHPGGALAREHWDKAQDGDFTKYVKNVTAPQVRELLTKYGHGVPAVFWWDAPCDMIKERSDMLLPLLKLQPGIICNNRMADGLGGIYAGDTEILEQKIPATGLPGRDWETCMTMNDTWGYKSYDNNWKSGPTLISNLVDIVSKGGNFLLNVGPTSEGLIPEPSVERLKEMGDWIKVNGEAIYGTSASPFKNLTWGRCSRKGGTLYFHVFDWPKDGKLVVPGLKNKVKKAYLLSDPDRARLAVKDSGNSPKIIEVGINAPDPVASVVAVEVDGEPDIQEAPCYEGKTVSEWLDLFWKKENKSEAEINHAIDSIGSAGMPELINALRSSKSGEVREQAAMALGRMGKDALSAVPALIEALDDVSFLVTEAADGALSGLVYLDDQAVSLIAAGVKHTDVDVRMAVLEILGGLGTRAKAAVPAIKAALNDEDAGVREFAAEVLKDITEE